MQISIVPIDGTIVIGGVGVTVTNDRLRSIVASDIHAIQYDESNSIGHIEYKRGPYDKNPRGNEMIYNEFDPSPFKELHAELLEEERLAIEQVTMEEVESASSIIQRECN